MFKTISAAVAIATFATTVFAADSRVEILCGAEHTNEVASANDVRMNPDGYYVESLGEQLSLGDPRIVLTNGATPYLCTRSAATPAMDATNIALNEDVRVVRWLFVKPHPLGK